MPVDMKAMLAAGEILDAHENAKFAAGEPHRIAECDDRDDDWCGAYPPHVEDAEFYSENMPPNDDGENPCD